MVKDNDLFLKLSGEADRAKEEKRKQLLKKVVVYLKADAKPHFPKKRDADGNVVKDEKGHEVRETVSDGFSYTFSEFGKSKVVKVVYPAKLKLGMLQAYVVSGLGYDIPSGNLIFIDEGSKIALYK